MIATRSHSRLGFVHVVGGQENRPAVLLEVLDQIPELPSCLRIEAGRRLVEKQQLRIADERARERQPLLLSARQRSDASRPLLLELHERDHAPRAAGPAGRSCETARASR